jgi:hypothetical protein
MNIHLIGSMREFSEDLPIMRAIAKIVNANTGFIALNWFEGVQDRKSRGTIPEESLDWIGIVDNNINSLIQADALIIEGSRFNYSQGYQTAIALQHNKPVLNLYRDDLPEYKEWPDKLFVSGISHPLFVSKAYRTEEDLERIVTKFLHDNAKKVHQLDVKLAVDDTAYKKLQNLAQEQNKSEFSVIKDIVLSNLDK